MDPLTNLHAQQHAHDYILHMIDTTLFLDYSTNKVHLKWLPLLEDFDAYGDIPWGSVFQIYLYKELYKVSMMQTSQFRDP